jgi:hypothetical protein
MTILKKFKTKLFLHQLIDIIVKYHVTKFSMCGDINVCNVKAICVYTIFTNYLLCGDISMKRCKS